jgi:hypothetical protein
LPETISTASIRTSSGRTEQQTRIAGFYFGWLNPQRIAVKVRESTVLIKQSSELLARADRILSAKISHP